MMAEALRYAGHAIHLGDQRYLVATSDERPFIIDMKTGQTEEIADASEETRCQNETA